MSTSVTEPNRPGPTRRVLVLKSPEYGVGGEHGERRLPYRIDLLTRSDLELCWTDRHLSGRWTEGRLGRLIRRSEAATTPWLQAVLTRRDRRHCDATIAMFESEGHGLALARRLSWRPRRRRGRPPLVIVACWLADLARSASPRRLATYRFVYGAVDRVVVFSSNQRATLTELVGIDPERIEVVDFGIDLDEIGAIGIDDRAGTVVAAGRDLGRDWPTLLAAATGSGWRVELVTRVRQIEGESVPPEVTVHGYVPRDDYLAMLAGAAVVVIPTDVREYPTGQTVLLEAMAMGKACVVTDTAAMADYVRHDETALLVPPGDAGALREAVDALLADEGRRHRIGEAARRDIVGRGGAATMWKRIASVVHDEIDRSRHHDENIKTSHRS